jgi:hypothetical protein
MNRNQQRMAEEQLQASKKQKIGTGQIVVTLPSNETITFPLGGNTTVAQLKDEIEKELHIDVKKQIVLVDGVMVKNNAYVGSGSVTLQLK